jgi:hypothetical protein
VLRPVIKLTLGNKLYDKQTLAFRLRRTQLPAIDRLDIALPIAVQFSAAAGDDCSLEIDGGDGAETVFTGWLTEIRRGFTGLHLTAHNGGLKLARYRPSSSFEKRSAGQIIDSLCSDASVTLAEKVDGPTIALYVLDGRGTAADEIARLALDSGAAGAFDGEGRLHVSEKGGPGGEIALRYGREAIAAAAGNALDEYPAFTVIGEGGGAPSSPQGQWVIADFSAGSAPAAGFTDRVVGLPEIRTTDDARNAAASLTYRRSTALSSVHLQLWMNPKIVPGMRLQLSDFPDAVPLAECRVAQVVHSSPPGGRAMTEIWGTGQTGSPLDLAGALAGAIGGLL